MGSKLSPIISNIFLSILEEKFIDENIIQGNILGYKRYVDDVFLVVNQKKQYFPKNKQFT